MQTRSQLLLLRKPCCSGLLPTCFAPPLACMHMALAVMLDRAAEKQPLEKHENYCNCLPASCSDAPWYLPAGRMTTASSHAHSCTFYAALGGLMCGTHGTHGTRTCCMAPICARVHAPRSAPHRKWGRCHICALVIARMCMCAYEHIAIFTKCTLLCIAVVCSYIVAPNVMQLLSVSCHLCEVVGSVKGWLSCSGGWWTEMLAMLECVGGCSLWPEWT